MRQLQSIRGELRTLLSRRMVARSDEVCPLLSAGTKKRSRPGRFSLAKLSSRELANKETQCELALSRRGPLYCLPKLSWTGICPSFSNPNLMLLRLSENSEKAATQLTQIDRKSSATRK